MRFPRFRTLTMNSHFLKRRTGQTKPVCGLSPAWELPCAAPCLLADGETEAWRGSVASTIRRHVGGLSTVWHLSQIEREEFESGAHRDNSHALGLCTVRPVEPPGEPCVWRGRGYDPVPFTGEEVQAQRSQAALSGHTATWVAEPDGGP